MSIHEIQDNINRIKLANVLMSYAINSGLNNQLAIQKVHEMKADKTPVKDYVLALSDGLRYGNWPWTPQNTTRGLMNQPFKGHYTNCPAYAGNEYPCNCNGGTL